jgi:hypothetical protein
VERTPRRRCFSRRLGGGVVFVVAFAFAFALLFLLPMVSLALWLFAGVRRI